jgi:hypothetical protein
MFDIKNPNSFLGGQNVHNLIIIGLLIYIIFKLMKNSSESSYSKCKSCNPTGGVLNQPGANAAVAALKNKGK